MAVRQQLTLSFEVAARVGLLALRGGKSSFRRSQSIELIFWIKFGQHLSRLDPVADIDRSLDHPPGDAKGTEGGYSAWQVEAAVAKMPVLRIEIVKRSNDRNGFVVLPRRWVVERFFSWFGRNRRLAKDFAKPRRDPGHLRYHRLHPACRQAAGQGSAVK